MTDLRLDWPGRPGAFGPLPPGQLPPVVERHGDAAHLLVEGDNLPALAALAAARPESVDLIYADPPFATGSTFRHRPTLGEARPAGEGFSDTFKGGLAGWLDVMVPRLRLMHALLSERGSLYLHLDPTAAAHARLVLDEIFGPEAFQREIVWRIGWISGFKSAAHNWIRNHDTLLYYVKTPGRATFNKRYLPHPPGYLRRDGKPAAGRGIPLDDVWNGHPGDTLDSIQIMSFSGEKTGYPTQKNESLVARIVDASSSPGDTVLDPFVGSGTAAVVAHRLGRKAIALDRGPAAMALTRRRLSLAGAGFEVRGDSPGALPAGLHLDAGTLRMGEDAPALDAIYLGVPAADGALTVLHALHRGRKAESLPAATDLPESVADALAKGAEAVAIDVHGQRWRGPIGRPGA